MRVQFTVDDKLGIELQTKAHDLGFSVSSYVRYLVKQSLDKKQPNQLDSAIEDVENGRVEQITFENFTK